MVKRFAADLPMLDQLDRIGGDRQPRRRLIRRAQPQPGVGGQHAVGVDEQRREFQLGDLGEIDDQLADPHQRLGDRVGCWRRAGRAAAGRAWRRCGCARSGRWPAAGSAAAGRPRGRWDCGVGAAAAEGDDRPEGRVVGHADGEFARSADLALHQQFAGRRRAARARRGQQPGGGGDLAGVVQVERPGRRAAVRRRRRCRAASPPRESRAARRRRRRPRRRRRSGWAPSGCRRRPARPAPRPASVSGDRRARTWRNSGAPASCRGARSSTVLGGSSRAAARLRRSRTRCWKPRTAWLGRGEDRQAGLRQRRRGAARPVVSPIAQTSSGTRRSLWRHRSRLAMVASSAAPAGACTTSTPPMSGRAARPNAVAASCPAVGTCTMP